MIDLTAPDDTDPVAHTDRLLATIRDPNANAAARLMALGFLIHNVAPDTTIDELLAAIDDVAKRKEAAPPAPEK